MKIGSIGAGKIGTAVARLAVRRGHEAMLSNSRGPGTIEDVAASIPCAVGTATEAAAFGDVVLVAIPFRNILALDPALFAGKIVMDANNYYPYRDGTIDALENGNTTTSEMLAAHLKGARVVKVWNAIFAKDIGDGARAKGAPHRRALPIAGDNAEAKRIVADLLDDLGFDFVDAGPLHEGWRFERARPAYCVPLDVAGLKTALANAANKVPEGSWRK